MNNAVKTGFCTIYKYSGLMNLQESLTRALGGSFLSIAVFHRVTDQIPEGDLTVSPARFEHMCRMFKKRFNVVPLAEIFRIARSGERFPARTMAITFDDGYRDNLFAAQTLSRNNLPACFFISTSYMGTRNVFAWDQGLPELPKLTWFEVRALDHMGFEIGSHSHTHADLGAVSLDAVRYELHESKRVLEDQLGHRVRWFAYPFGKESCFPPDRLPLVAEAGYDGCVSAYGGFFYPGMDTRLLPRENVPTYSPVTLELRLSGCLCWLYRIRYFTKGRGGQSMDAKTCVRGEQEEKHLSQTA